MGLSVSNIVPEKLSNYIQFNAAGFQIRVYN